MISLNFQIFKIFLKSSLSSQIFSELPDILGAPRSSQSSQIFLELLDILRPPRYSQSFQIFFELPRSSQSFQIFLELLDILRGPRYYLNFSRSPRFPLDLQDLLCPPRSPGFPLDLQDLLYPPRSPLSLIFNSKFYSRNKRKLYLKSKNVFSHYKI